MTDEKVMVADLTPEELEKYDRMQQELKRMQTAREQAEQQFAIIDKYFPNKVFVAKILADEITATHHFKTMVGSKITYYYNSRKGVYEENGIEKIGKLTTDILGSVYKKHFLSEVISIITNSNPIYPDSINNKWLNVLNGLVDIKTLEFREHDPDIFSLSQIPAKYDKDADCPLIDEFLSEVVAEEDIAAMYEMGGYCLYNGYPINKAFLFIGDGSNGKTTLINLFRTFLGKGNIKAISLHQLEESPYAKGWLYGKKANLFADLKDKALEETGTFKMLIGGDLITTDVKWGNALTFVNTAKMIFSANKPPKVKDDTTAYWRRWQMVNFPNTFIEGAADIKKLDKITQPMELSGFLNKCLEGLKRLLDNGEFSNAESLDDVRDNYMRMSNSIWAFVEDVLDSAAEYQITKEKMYNAYIGFCKEEKLPSRSKKSFGGEIQEYITLEQTSPKIDGKQRKSWRGAKFKEKYDKYNSIGVGDQECL